MESGEWKEERGKKGRSEGGQAVSFTLEKDKKWLYNLHISPKEGIKYEQSQSHFNSKSAD